MNGVESVLVVCPSSSAASPRRGGPFDKRRVRRGGEHGSLNDRADEGDFRSDGLAQFSGLHRADAARLGGDQFDAARRGLPILVYADYDADGALAVAEAMLWGGWHHPSPTYVALVLGATVALSPRFSASGFWDEVRACGATTFNLLGSMLNILWAQPASPADRSPWCG